MKFWDSTAIVPLLVGEQSSEALQAEFERDPMVLAWWGAEVECVSALTRRERDGDLESAALAIALRRLDALIASWREILPADVVRRTALRLLRVHPLRAADSLQLAAAIVGATGRPDSLPFVTLDKRLALAALREGFRVLDPTTNQDG